MKRQLLALGAVACALALAGVVAIIWLSVDPNQRPLAYATLGTFVALALAGACFIAALDAPDR